MSSKVENEMYHNYLYMIQNVVNESNKSQISMVELNPELFDVNVLKKSLDDEISKFDSLIRK